MVHKTTRTEGRMRNIENHYKAELKEIKIIYYLRGLFLAIIVSLIVLFSGLSFKDFIEGALMYSLIITICFLLVAIFWYPEHKTYTDYKRKGEGAE